MPDELTERMGRLPSTLPPRAWAPAAELRRIGRYRRRRRLAVVSLAVVIAILGGTGLGLRLVRTTAGPVPPGTSSPSTTIPSSPPRVASGPVPASVMLVDADLPDGYEVTDQIVVPAAGTRPTGGTTYQLVTACAAYRELNVTALTIDHDGRYHTYHIGHDLTSPRIDEIVLRFPTPAAMMAARTDLRRLVERCAGAPDPAADWFAFAVEVTGSPTQYWIVAGGRGSNLLAIVRTPEPMPALGPVIVAHLVSE